MSFVSTTTYLIFLFLRPLAHEHADVCHYILIINKGRTNRNYKVSIWNDAWYKLADNSNKGEAGNKMSAITLEIILLPSGVDE